MKQLLSTSDESLERARLNWKSIKSGGLGLTLMNREEKNDRFSKSYTNRFNSCTTDGKTLLNTALLLLFPLVCIMVDISPRF